MSETPGSKSGLLFDRTIDRPLMVWITMGSAYSADDIARSKKPLELPKGARHVHVGSCYASNLRDPSFREGTDEPPSSTTVGFMQYLLFRLDSIPQLIPRTSDLPSPQRLISYPSACAKINLNLRASLQVSGVTHWSRSEMILEEELLPLNLDRPPCLTSYQLPATMAMLLAHTTDADVLFFFLVCNQLALGWVESLP